MLFLNAFFPSNSYKGSQYCLINQTFTFCVVHFLVLFGLFPKVAGVVFENNLAKMLLIDVGINCCC